MIPVPAAAARSTRSAASCEFRHDQAAQRAGPFCWCCCRLLANERFSGRGHRQHLCKDCNKLGKQELAFRQQQRNIDRLLTCDGTIPRKHRASFERYLAHPDQPVRQYATEVKQHDDEQRQRWYEMLEAERLEEQRLEQEREHVERECVANEGNDRDRSPWEDEDLPF